MADITHGTWIKDGKAVDKVFSDGKQVYGRNLLAGTSNVLTTVSDAIGWSYGLPWYPTVEQLKANQTYTLSCYLEPVEHDVCVCAHTTNGNTFGTTVAAGTKGFSALTMALTPEDVKVFSCWTTFTNEQKDNSTVSYKGFKLEKGTIATPWSPAPEDVLK